MKTTVIFDLDGTLLDTLDDLHAALNRALTENGLPERSRNEVRAFVGNGIPLLAHRGVPSGTAPETERRVLDALLSFYTAHCRERTCPYPGVTDALSALKERGVRVAVVTNKAQAAAETLCGAYFGGLADCVVGGRPDLPKKPAPEPVFEALKALGVSAREAVYVGDSEVDLKTAENVGLPILPVGWGFRTPGQLFAAGAHTVYMTAEALLGALLEPGV